MAEKTVFVFAYLPGEVDAVPAGELTLLQDGAKLIASRFVYGTRYIARPAALEIDPISLQFKVSIPRPGEIVVPKNGLPMFGAIADTGPDLWGRRVIEMQLNAPPNGLPESEYLLHTGNNRVGALDIRADLKAASKTPDVMSVKSLDRMVEAAQKLEAGEKIPKSLLKLLQPGSSMGGARPKAVIEHENFLWIAKFPSRSDPYNVPRVEYATMQLARACGLNVPVLQIVTLDDGQDVMLIRRFDRIRRGASYSRHHYVSALTLLGKHETESANSSYVDIATAIRAFCDQDAIKKDNHELFARMVFNILCNNDDDHLKNHGFLWNGSGFTLSPLFDVVPRATVATGRHLHLSVGTSGRSATLPNAMSKHASFDLSIHDAVETIERVASVVREWKTYFGDIKVSQKDMRTLEKAFRRPRDIGLEEVLKMVKRRSGVARPLATVKGGKIA